MNRKIVSLVFISLLILSTAIVTATLVTTPVAAAKTAWLKIVTPAWKGTTTCILPDGSFVTVGSPVCPDPAYKGFADRFNVTDMEAFVEVYGIKPEWGYTPLQGTFEPNATGFVQISWSVDDTWGLLVLVKAKSYYGEKIGAKSPFKGIIIYGLLIPPRNADPTKIQDMIGFPVTVPGNYSVNIDGSLYTHPAATGFDFSKSGTFDLLDGDSVNLASFAKAFNKPENAWVARAAKIFKLFHVHSWYDVKDNLSFAQIKIYDLDHTDPTSEASLIQAAVTGQDGQSRYTREIYPPEEGLKDGKFENNKLVPIPLQIFNINNKTVFHGGIVENPSPLGDYIVGAPQLNATVRVWWETVIVNQTIYYGRYINGTLGAEQVDGLDKYAPTFVGPLNIWHNVTNPDEDYPVANFINATVFYAHFCTYDNDTLIGWPLIHFVYTNLMAYYDRIEDIFSYLDEVNDTIASYTRVDMDYVVGQMLVNAKVSINLKTTNDVAYYMTKNILTTNVTGCTDDPHKYRGGLANDMARFPNGTIWLALYKDDDGNGIPDYFDDREIRTFWEKFGKHVWLNASLMYNPGDARNKDDIPEGPKLQDVKNPTRIGDEDVLESSYFNGNWSMLVANVKYANTLTLKDDKEYTGLDVLVSWKGGWQNIYPGSEQLVAEFKTKNPYGIAVIFDTWVEQPDFAIVYDPVLKRYKLDPSLENQWISWDAPILVLGDVDGLTRGRVIMTTYVYDIVFYVVDALGNPLPPSDTEVCLRLPNGNFYCRAPSIDETLDTGMMWSYKYFGEGNVTFFQLPGNKGPYGLRVTYLGTQVYYKIDQINVLTKTEFPVIRTTVYKVKVVFFDCEDKVIPSLWIKYTLPNGWTDWRQTSEYGEVEFPYIAAGTLTISRAWWKGIEIPLMKATDASGKKLDLTPEGALVLGIQEDVDMPVKVWVPIKDIIFYTMDFQGEIKIPRLNITVTWLGTPKPWSTEKIYYLETLDPTGDTEDADDDVYTREDFNTSVIVHPLWFRYDIDTFFQKIADDSPMDGMTEYEAKYVFYKMPPAIYNITVTTVVRDVLPKDLWMPDDEQSPGNSKWPGRIDAEVPYEIKIDWKGWSEEYEDTIPEIRTGPPDVVNDRVVLRIFGSMNGVPVTTENFPAWLVDAWNPELVGIRTALVCEEEVKLKTWAHDFWKSVIDGDYRVGDAEFKILNDNGEFMIYYDLDEKMWVGNTYKSKWTEDIKDISGIMKDSFYTSNIYWNGSYLLADLRFKTNMTYSYSKGENASFIVDKFYNASAVNDVAPTLNFTLVGTENLWKTDSRFAEWVKRIDGNTWKDWFDAWLLVYELPKDTDEYKVAKGPDGKGILPIPLPVAFVKL
ncbi:MAG: hypothetical protein QW724_08210, partial [Nitrososphaerota archaeon]